MTLDQHVERELAKAREEAEKGEAFYMELLLESAKELARNVGQDISTQVTSIQREGYTKTIFVKLVKARESAERGNVDAVRNFIELVKIYAAEAYSATRESRDIRAQVSSILREGYERAIPVELAKARESAEQGDAVAMEHALLHAREYAQRLGQDISSQVASIDKKGCYDLAVSVELAKAETYGRKGKDVDMREHLELAQIYARRAGGDITVEAASFEGRVGRVGPKG